MKRISAIFLTGLLVFCLLSFQKKATEDIMYWSGKPLTWNDFKPRTKGIGEEVALTSAGIISGFSSKNSEMRITCYFDKNESWVVTGKESVEILKHEQGHFDIEEMYARMFRKQVTSTSFSRKNIQDKFTTLSNEISADTKKKQALYDKETNHGIDSLKQNEWSNKIKTDLDGLKAYANDTIIQIKL